MRITAGLFAVAALGCLATLPLEAQFIRGQVVDSTSGAPVKAGFVILRSVSGTELQRTLTTRDGRFTIQPPGAGVYRLRSERIGYGAWDSPTIRIVPGDTLDFVLRVSALPIILSTITVEEETPCQIRATDREDTGILWEEVRKALVAASWSAAQGLFRHELQSYRRTLDRSRRRVSQEEVSLTSGYYRSPFASRSADSLALQGYVVNENDGEWIWYYAPDATVLRDETFQSTHCFSIVRDTRDGIPLVGLAFVPIPTRQLPDVEGTLWMEEESSALSRLEFRYTGLENVPEDDRIGGTVEFLAMPSGAWIVHRWQIRTPRLVPRQLRGLYVTRTEAVIRGFSDVGGEVVRIQGQDGSTVYTSPNVVRVTGVVFDSTRRKPLRGAAVSIEGTPYSAVTAPNGTFDIAALVNGEYGITFTHPGGDYLGYVPEQDTVNLTPRDSEIEHLELPSVESILHQRCPATTSQNTRALVGTVRDEAGRVVGKGVGVTVSWQRFDMSTGGGSLSIRDRGEQVFTDDKGRYISCGLPLENTITVRVEGGEGTGDAARLRFRPGIVEVAKRATDTSPYVAYGWEERIWPLDLQAVAPPRNVVFIGVVTDITTTATIDGVVVVLNGAAVAVTDDDGQFNVIRRLVENESNKISIRHPGYQPFEREVTLAPGQDEIRLTLSLRPAG